MANLLISSNITTMKNLLSNRIIQTCVVNSLKNGSLNCHNCQKLQRNFTTVSRLRNLNLNSRDVRHFREEIQAFGKLLQRSGYIGSAEFNGFLSSGNRHFSTSSKRQNEKKNGENEKKHDEDEDREKDKFPSSILLSLVWTTAMLMIVLSFGFQSTVEGSVSWNEFVSELLLKGEVDEIYIQAQSQAVFLKLHEGARFKGQPVSNMRFLLLKVPDTTKLEEKIRKIEQDIGVKVEDQVSISYNRPRTNWFMMGVLVISVILGVLLISVSKRSSLGIMDGMRGAKFVRVDILSQQNKDKAIRFKDVAGLKEAKEEMLEFVDYLKTPDRYKELGAKIPRGAILLGPPGCGKTLLARAVASEAGVPFLAMAGSEFVEMIGGVGAARVRDLFKEAKKKAPCIVYLDEVDAIGRKRSGGSSSNSESENTLNQLLVEMDGMETNKGVIMLASTNRADVLDNALLRRGRFDRHITIDLPTMIERQEIFEMYARKLKLSTTAESVSPKLAQLSPGMSGADIANVCNEAAIHAARYSKKVIEPTDFQHALERIIAGASKKSKLLSPSEKKMVAYHECGHALVGWMLQYTDALLKISIVPRTNNALGFTQFLPSDKKLHSKQELFERMCMALGGRAAEVLIFNQTTTGARDDLDRVTKLAFEQIRSYGMNERIGPISFDTESLENTTAGMKPFSKKLAAAMDEEARILIGQAFSQTVELLQSNKDKLHKLSAVLLENEELSYEEIKKLIGPPPFGEKNLIELVGWEGDLPASDTLPPVKPSKPSEA